MPQEPADGRLLVDAVPGVARTELPRAIAETLRDRKSRTLKHLSLASGTDTRLMNVKVAAVAGGTALFWQDVASARARRTS